MRNDSPSAAVILRVFKRDRFQCTYCGAPGTDAELQADHIIAVSKGGSHHISNLTTACRVCNQSKGNREAPAFGRARGSAAALATVSWPETLEDFLASGATFTPWKHGTIAREGTPGEVNQTLLLPDSTGSCVEFWPGQTPIVNLFGGGYCYHFTLSRLWQDHPEWSWMQQIAQKGWENSASDLRLLSVLCRGFPVDKYGKRGATLQHGRNTLQKVAGATATNATCV